MKLLSMVVATATLIAAGQAAARGSLAEISVYDRTEGRWLQTYRHQGRTYIVGKPGHEYQLRVQNRSREDVLAVHPEGQRRFYEFSDVAVSNCNAYWIGHLGALKAAEAFRGGGQFVKKPIRVMQAFGLINLLRFRFGLGPIHHIFRRISRRLKVEVAPLLVSNWVTAHVPPERITLRSNSFVNQLMSVRAGLGIALLPCYLAERDPAVRRISAVMPEVASELWIVTHEDLKNTARIRAFLAHIGDAIVAARRSFEGAAQGREL